MTNRKCFECDTGTYNKVRESFNASTQDGEVIEVPMVVRWRCTDCGDEILPPESSRQIEDWIAEREERFTPAMVEDFLANFGSDQTKTAIILGLGLKTLHRWSKGTQQVSRSMGYYLRALRRFPEVFEWIRERGWRREVSVTGQAQYFVAIGGETDEKRFPSLARAIKKNQFIVRHQENWNPALELCCSPRR